MAWTIEVSRKAAEKIDLIQDGTAPCRIEVLEYPAVEEHGVSTSSNLPESGLAAWVVARAHGVSLLVCGDVDVVRVDVGVLFRKTS